MPYHGNSGHKYLTRPTQLFARYVDLLHLGAQVGSSYGKAFRLSLAGQGLEPTADAVPVIPMHMRRVVPHAQK